MHYYAKIIKKEGQYLVSFPDLANINTYGNTLSEAVHNAEEALNGSLESDFERGFSLPEPKERKGNGYYRIPVLPVKSTWLPIGLSVGISGNPPGIC
jgi:antitoxin HicB